MGSECLVWNIYVRDMGLFDFFCSALGILSRSHSLDRNMR